MWTDGKGGRTERRRQAYTYRGGGWDDSRQEIVQDGPKIIKLKGSPRRRLNTHSDSPKSKKEKKKHKAEPKGAIQQEVRTIDSK